MSGMKQAMRWYGPTDRVTLENIRQAGCTDVVSALHDIPIGSVWGTVAIRSRQKTIADAGLKWTVVESLPVHEDIKRQSGNYREFIHNYIETLRNLAHCGLEVITYNFMPVLDWVRTDIAFRLPNDAEALRFQLSAFAAFDLFILKRDGAANDYDIQTKDAATRLHKNMSSEELNRLAQTTMMGLPGSTESFSKMEILNALDTYKGIGQNELRNSLAAFVSEVAPEAASLGLVLAIHPDDPPFPLLGLPRVVSTQEDIRFIMNASPHIANGLCFCTGSLGSRGDNNLVNIIEEFGDRIHFLHLRNTHVEPNGDFHEADHLGGTTDMVAIVSKIVKLMKDRNVSLPMRPDHGHRMLGDLEIDFYPGYSAIGRLKALAELRGLEKGLLAQVP